MEDTKKFLSCIQQDQRLVLYDLKGSIAHVQMLAYTKIIPSEDAEKIINGLKEIEKDFLEGKEIFRPDDEDIHLAIERILTEKIGSVAGKMHTARSRNDQVCVDMRLYLKDEIFDILNKLKELKRSLREKSQQNLDVIFPGYTHFQPAQPILFAHYLMAYHWMFWRDYSRMKSCLSRVDVLPLGSGALAGFDFPIDRQYLAQLLNFSKISENSLDTISERDYIIEFISTGAIIFMHISRMMEEFIIWSNPNFGFIKLADEFCSGSSIMPQKRNPDVAELLRGRASKIYANLVGILTLTKNLPLGYNRDFQDDKEYLFSTVDNLKQGLTILKEMIISLQIDKEKMYSACELGFIQATDISNYLVKKGLAFRDAYNLVAEIVRYCQKKNLKFDDLSIDDFKKFSPLFATDIKEKIKIENIVKSKNSWGGTSPEQIINQIKIAEEKEEK